MSTVRSSADLETPYRHQCGEEVYTASAPKVDKCIVMTAVIRRGQREVPGQQLA